MWLLPITIVSSVLLGILISEYNKPKIVNKLSNEEKNLVIKRINQLKGREFEVFTSKIYKLMGYKIQLTQATNDGGKDVVINKKGEKIFVECKNHAKKNSIGRPEAQKLCGSMVASNVSKGIILSVNGFNKNCKEYCKKVKGKKVQIQSIECIDIVGFLQCCDEIDKEEIFKLLNIEIYDKENKEMHIN